MIDRLVHALFWWTPLREAIFDEVHLYDHLDKILKEDDGTRSNLSWCEDDGLWRGWMFQEKHKIYLFDDIGHEAITDLWQGLWERNLEHDLAYL